MFVELKYQYSTKPQYCLYKCVILLTTAKSQCQLESMDVEICLFRGLHSMLHMICLHNLEDVVPNIIVQKNYNADLT